MANRHVRYAPVGEHQPLHINALGTVVAVGHAVGTSAAGVNISPGQTVTVTPSGGSGMNGIVPNMQLSISGAGPGQPEDVIIISTVPGTSFTATFQQSHVGTIQISGHRGTFLGRLIVNQPGTGITITLYNGNPNNTNAQAGYQGQPIAVISGLAAGQVYIFDCTCDAGLFYTVAGTTAGDYTLTYLDHDK